MSWWDQISNNLLTWGPMVFMALIVFFLWRTMKLMPKTKPQEIKPDSDSSIEWDEVAGVDQAKAELREVVEFLTDPERFKPSSARRCPRASCCTARPAPARRCWPRPWPTSPARSSTRSRPPASSRCSPASARPASGACSPRRARTRPAIVFIDEIDAVGAERGSDNNSEREQTLNQLLVEMDGFIHSGDLVVIAASNLLDKLDPALLRPGRFDRQIFVSPPDVVGRKAILGVHTPTSRWPRTSTSSVIARQTSGLTGAELANICNEAAIAAARGLRPRVEHADFEYALERVVAGMETRHTLNERERRVVAFHEAGHALLRRAAAGHDRTHRVSIVPRGSALGYVLHLPEEDRYLDTRAELMDQLVVLLGGRAAEQLVFGSITSGASDDL